MILDTCALLWLAAGSDELGQSARREIDAASRICISAITGWEIGLKHGQGKLYLPMPPGEWLEKTLLHHRIDVLPLDLQTCVKATELPPVHRDPCDRLIIATAAVHRLPVATADRRFAAYGVEVVW